MSCLFCKIVSGEIPAKLVMDTEDTMAFRDINPQAPTHVLVIPKKHIVAVRESGPDDTLMLGRLVAVARDIAKAEGLEESGYRLVINDGENAGQSVFHIHLHLLGGRRLAWPPG